MFRTVFFAVLLALVVFNIIRNTTDEWRTNFFDGLWTLLKLILILAIIWGGIFLIILIVINWKNRWENAFMIIVASIFAIGFIHECLRKPTPEEIKQKEEKNNRKLDKNLTKNIKINCNAKVYWDLSFIEKWRYDNVYNKKQQEINEQEKEKALLEKLWKKEYNKLKKMWEYEYNRLQSLWKEKYEEIKEKEVRAEKRSKWCTKFMLIILWILLLIVICAFIFMLVTDKI